MTDTANKTLIKLDFPFSLNGQKVGELTMRRPKVEDLRQSRSQGGDDGLEQDLVLFGRMCGINPEELAQNLDMKDWNKLQRAYEAFLS